MPRKSPDHSPAKASPPVRKRIGAAATPTSRLHRTLDPAQTGEAAQQLANDLHKRIIGQSDAIDQIVSLYQVYKAGLCDQMRPIGNFLFLGPTGTGKTRTVEALAESLVGTSKGVIKIDCAEFQHSHEIAKLLGSPPGYLGHRETRALLTQENLRKHHTASCKVSFILFDEIEKASDALWNLLLGILDKGSLTLGDNTQVDFSQCMIFLTSNLGAREMEKLASPSLGFAPSVGDGDVARVASGAARRKFTPEFMNRLDKVVVFKPLNEVALGQILELEIAAVQERILAAAKSMFVLRVEDEARSVLLKEGFDPKYGARHLRRSVEKRLVHPLANLIASGQIVSGDLICVGSGPSGFIFTVGDQLPPEDVV